MAWSCIGLRAALNVWRMEVWLPTWESAHRNNNQPFSLSSKCIAGCSSHMVHWHAPCSNTTAELRKGRELATVVSWAVRISNALENLEDAGLIAHRVTKLVLGAAADTVHCFWWIWILAFGTRAFYASLSAKGLKLLNYIRLNVWNLKT